MHNLDVQRARRLVLAQLFLSLLLAVMAGFHAWHTARDVLIGGTAAWLGNAMLALWVFGRYRAQEPGSIVARFYGGELIKIVTIMAVFVAAIKGFDDFDPIAVFGAFLVVQVLPPLLANRIAR